MKLKKTCFSTKISDLWGRDNYQSHFEVGREYWDFFDTDSEIYRRTGEHWNRIRITYIRSGVLFYTFSDAPDIKEDFMPVSCFRASALVLAELDPVKDLGENILGNIETAKLGYCFDDTRTIIHNWPNENEVEITDEKQIWQKLLYGVNEIVSKPRKRNDELSKRLLEEAEKMNCEKFTELVKKGVFFKGTEDDYDKFVICHYCNYNNHETNYCTITPESADKCPLLES